MCGRAFPRSFRHNMHACHMRGCSYSKARHFSRRTVLALLNTGKRIKFRCKALRVGGARRFHATFATLRGSRGPTIFVDVPSCGGASIIAMGALGTISARGFAIGPFP